MIYLVRHGQTDWNHEHRIQGHLDIPLNQTGRDEAFLCGKKLSSIKRDNIIASDLLRAKETASTINHFFSLSIKYDYRLRELNFGDLQGLIVEDINDESWHLLNKRPHKIHAESLSDVYIRVKSFFNELDEKTNTLIVTHGGVIRMVKYLSDHPNSFDLREFEKTALQFKIKNTEIFKWDRSQTFQYLV